MGAVSKAKLSWQDFFVLLILLLFLEGSAFFVATDAFVIGVFLVFLAISIYKGIKFDIGLVFLLALWTLINIFSIWTGGRGFSAGTFIGYTIKMCIPYFAVKLVGPSFFEKFFKFCFYLVAISSCFYIIEVIFPNLVQSLTPYLNFLEYWRMKENGDFYIIVYNHLGVYNQYYGIFPRNCGFMWEPGAYALVLNFLIAYKIHRDSYRFDKSLALLVLAMISTFSTAGYIGFFVLVVFFVLRKGMKSAPILIPVALVVIVYASINLYSTTDFLSGKIEEYMEMGMYESTAEFNGETWERTTRFGIAAMSLENSLHRPFGDGICISPYFLKKWGRIAAPNSLATILMSWGWLGLLMLVVSIWKFNPGLKKGLGPMLLLPLCISLFSNPYDACKYLIFAIFYYTIVCNNFKSTGYLIEDKQ